MKPFGSITRGTTNPNRLRRIDVWMAWRYQALLAPQHRPLVVDLGYGQTPVTTQELYARLVNINPRLEVIGLEIDPERVASAQKQSAPGVTFQLGGFEIPTAREPQLIRAFNVLRQYQESEVHQAWSRMQSRLAPDGRLVEGTCDEIGRKAVWVELDSQEPLSLTFATHLRSLKRPSELAPRLPKILIHRNLAGEPIHRFLQAMDSAWEKSSPLSVFSSRQRWAHMVESLRSDWPILTPTSRQTHGEITLAWSAIA